MKELKIVVPMFDKKDVQVVTNTARKFVAFGAAFLNKKFYQIVPKKEEVKEVPIAHGYIMEVSVAGVTYGNRQEIIKTLTGNEICEFKHNPTPEFPNQTEIYVGGKMVGYVPDNKNHSDAKILLDKVAKGKGYTIKNWIRVGSLAKDKFAGLRVFINVGE